MFRLILSSGLILAAGAAGFVWTQAQDAAPPTPPVQPALPADSEPLPLADVLPARPVSPALPSVSDDVAPVRPAGSDPFAPPAVGDPSPTPRVPPSADIAPAAGTPSANVPGLFGASPSPAPPMLTPPNAQIGADPLVARPVLDLPSPDAMPVDDNTTVVNILPLQYAPAQNVLEVVRGVYSDQSLQIVADERTNSLLIKATVTQLDEIKQLITKLDVSDEQAGPARVLRRMLSREEQLKERRVLELESLIQEEALLRDRSQADEPTPDARVASLLDQLRVAVDESFNERQRQQLAEIDELTARLQKLAKAVREREARREEIIEQRLRQLTSNEDPKPAPDFNFTRPRMPDVDHAADVTTPSPDVSTSLADLQRLLSQLFPNEAIEVVQIGQGGGSVRLGGFVSNHDVRRQLMDVAEQFYPTVLDHLTLRTNEPIVGSQGGSPDSDPMAASPLQPASLPPTVDLSVDSSPVDKEYATTINQSHGVTSSVPSLENINQLRTRIQDHAASLRDLTTKISLQSTTQHPVEVQQTLASLRSRLDEDTRDCGTYRELIQLQLEAAKAQYEAAAKSKERIDQLALAGAIPAEKIDKARLLLESHHVQFQQSEILLKMISDIEQSAASALSPPDETQDEPELGLP